MGLCGSQISSRVYEDALLIELVPFEQVMSTTYRGLNIKVWFTRGHARVLGEQDLDPYDPEGLFLRPSQPVL